MTPTSHYAASATPQSAWLTLGAAPPIAGRPGGAPANGTATTGAPATPAGAQGAPPTSPFGGQMFMILIAVLGFMIVMSMMTGRRERKKREQMLSSIARHDRVQTVGGVIGTVVEVRDDEIVLKVDESTNTRIHFARSAVQNVLKKGRESRESKAEEPAEAGAES